MKVNEALYGSEREERSSSRRCLSSLFSVTIINISAYDPVQGMISEVSLDVAKLAGNDAAWDDLR